jgi:hypothetical protein
VRPWEKLDAMGSSLIGLLVLLFAIIFLVIGLASIGESPETEEEEQDRNADFCGGFFCGTITLWLAALLLQHSWTKMDVDKKRYLQETGIPGDRNHEYAPEDEFQRLPPQLEAEEIIQGIGNYITGNEPELWSEVIQEPELSEEGVEPLRVAPGEEATRQLEKVLQVVWADGVLTDDEYRILQVIREQHQISWEEYRSLEKEVRDKVAKPCLVCKSPLQYAKAYDAWYCWSCESYQD